MASVSDSKLFQLDLTSKPGEELGIVIVKTEWNAAIVDELENGCLRALHHAGIKHIQVLTVPGAIEIAFAIKSFWEFQKYKKPPNAIIALGCIIKGDTPHFEYVCKAVTEGVVQLNLLLPIPTIFGVLTVDNKEQALERTGGIHGHKGEEAAITAIKMISLVHSIKKSALNSSSSQQG